MVCTVAIFTFERTYLLIILLSNLRSNECYAENGRRNGNRDQIYPRADSSELKIKSEKDRYTSNFAPSIFPSNLEPSPKKKKKKKNNEFYPIYMFQLQERDEYPEYLDSKIGIDDFIFNFEELRANYSNKLGILMDHWQVQFSSREAFFFKLSIEDVGKIKSSIKIKDSMNLEVVLSGRIMDPFDLTWVVPPTLFITRWSQLKMLLYEFGVVNGRKLDNKGLPTILV